MWYDTDYTRDNMEHGMTLLSDDVAAQLTELNDAWQATWDEHFDACDECDQEHNNFCKAGVQILTDWKAAYHELVGY